MRTGPVLSVQAKDGGLLVEVGQDGVQLTWTDVIAGWRERPDFNDAFSSALAGSLYPAFFWECPPLDPERLRAPFECMLLPALGLQATRSDKTAFSGIVDADGSDVVVVPNLSGDAELVIPCDDGAANYAHLATFLRTASKEQVRLLWRRVGETASRWLQAHPRRRFWLSTSGLGVAWLHVRLDSRPKYYSYAPYRK